MIVLQPLKRFTPVRGRGDGIPVLLEPARERLTNDKLVVYHDKGEGELYDLEADPEEFDDLWLDPAAAAVKAELLQRSFDASMMAMDRGPRRVGPI